MCAFSFSQKRIVVLLIMCMIKKCTNVKGQREASYLIPYRLRSAFYIINCFVVVVVGFFCLLILFLKFLTKGIVPCMCIVLYSFFKLNALEGFLYRHRWVSFLLLTDHSVFLCKDAACFTSSVLFPLCFALTKVLGERPSVPAPFSTLV